MGFVLKQVDKHMYNYNISYTNILYVSGKTVENINTKDTRLD